MSSSRQSVSSPSHALHALLEVSHWTRNLSKEQLSRVRADIVERLVPAGAYACRKDERVEYWVGVAEGLLKLSTDSPDGKTATLTGIAAGGWFGEGSLLRTETRRYDAVALRDSRLALMPRATFTWLLDSSISFNRFLLDQLNERLGQIIGMLEYERLLSPEARIARCVGMLFNAHLQPGVEARMQLSQEEIGYLSGVSRQRANQALSVLAQAGLVRLEYGGITVLNVEGLKNYDG